MITELFEPVVGRRHGPDGRGRFAEERQFLANGVFDLGYLFRYGSWIPDVMVASSRLIVSSKMRRMLSSTRATFEPVKSIIITAPDADWRAWDADWVSQIKKLRRQFEVDDAQDIVMPWNAVCDGVLVRPLDTIRQGMAELGTEEFWVVLGESALSQAMDERGRGTPAVLQAESRGGIYRIPWLFNHSVCVEEWVTDILVPSGGNDEIHMRKLGVTKKLA